MGKYFKVLTLSEVTDFLQSDEYKNANNPEGTEISSCWIDRNGVRIYTDDGRWK